MKLKLLLSFFCYALTSVFVANPAFAASPIEYELIVKLIASGSLKLRVQCASSAANATGHIPLTLQNGQLRAVGTVAQSNDRFQFQANMAVSMYNDGRYSLAGTIDLVDTSASDILVRPFVRLGVPLNSLSGYSTPTLFRQNSDWMLLVGGGIFADSIVCQTKLVTQ